MQYAFLFPGQGSQIVGMGKNIAKSWDVANRVFTEANEVVDIDLKKLCFSGPQNELTATQNAQAAILTTSVAILRVLQSYGVHPDSVAGHSVGSFAALVAAESLSFADALRLVRTRGQLMAAVRQQGGMVAVISASEDRLEQVCTLAEGYVDVAGYNSPHQTVFSGTLEALQQLRERISTLSGVQVRPFAVSHAFHSRLMQEQKGAWSQVLSHYRLAPARIPVGLNVTGEYSTQPEAIRADLIEQFTAPVQWRTLFTALVERRVGTLFEVGMGRTLSGFARAWPQRPMVLETESVEAIRRCVQLQSKEQPLVA